MCYVPTALTQKIGKKQKSCNNVLSFLFVKNNLVKLGFVENSKSKFRIIDMSS